MVAQIEAGFETSRAEAELFLFIVAGATLGPEFVLLDLQSQMTLHVAGDTASSNEVQQAFFIQLRGPTDGHLQPRSNREIMI
jgi:hypothetical protein